MEENTEQTSPEETTSQETPKTEETKTQPFSDEQETRMQQLIGEATSKAREEGKKEGKSEMQGIKDREVADANKRTRAAQNEAASYKTSFGTLDEDTQKDVELARYREQDKYYQSSAQEEAQKQQEAAYYQRMNEGVLSYLEDLGIPKDDKRIDWGAGSQDYIEARKRLDTSVAKIVGSDRKAAEGKLNEGFKELESKLRKDLNLDSVDTTTSSTTETSDDFHSRVSNLDRKLTKKDMEDSRVKGII